MPLVRVCFIEFTGCQFMVIYRQGFWVPTISVSVKWSTNLNVREDWNQVGALHVTPTVCSASDDRFAMHDWELKGLVAIMHVQTV